MKVLVIGSGGREHALAWAARRSPSVDQVYVVPGNPGTKRIATNVPLEPNDFQRIRDFCIDAKVDLVVVGPENPLASGIADFLRRSGIAVFGPNSDGARLEASKSWAKEFMSRHGIPHAAYRTFTVGEVDEALSYLASTRGPWVVKADGLALGKGVTVATERAEAESAVRGLLSGNLLGEAGRKLIIEEYLPGRELTAMALTDGCCIWTLPFARDHKRAFDGDSGPMTGGMGAYSPVVLSRDEVEGVRDVLEKTLKGLASEGIDYRGTIYAGLMLTEDGPKVLEYNVRFGDPETQCVLPRITGDFAGALIACATGRLGSFLRENELEVRPEAAVTIVLASQGYPGEYRKGVEIPGLSRTDPSREGIFLFQAGTKEKDGATVTSGGRVLAVTALGRTVEDAAASAYREVELVAFDGAHYRRDIAGYERAELRQFQ